MAIMGYRFTVTVIRKPHGFIDKLREAEPFEEKLKDRLSRFLFLQKVKKIPYDPQNPSTVQQQKEGVDIVIRSEEAKFDIKIRDNCYYKRGILIETMSVLEQKKLGWFYTSKAHAVAYAWWNKQKTNLMREGFLLLLQDPQLKEWFETNKDKYHILKTHSKQNGNLWTTCFKIIPINDFPKGTLILYGQPKIGIVMVKVTSTIQKEVEQILKLCEM